MATPGPNGSLDFEESNCEVAPIGKTRVRRRGGILEQSTDLSEYQPINSGLAFNVEDFGAVGDGQQLDGRSAAHVVVTHSTDGGVATTHIAQNDAEFTAADVGKTIWVFNKAAPTTAFVAETTIAAVVNSHEVYVLGDAGATMDSDQGCIRYGTDDTDAFIDAFNAANTTTGSLTDQRHDTILIPAGQYIITERWYDYSAADSAAPNVVCEDGEAVLIMSPDITIPGDGSAVYMRCWSSTVTIRGVRFLGTDAHLALASQQSYIDIRGLMVRTEELWLQNVSSSLYPTFGINYTLCNFLRISGGGVVHSNGYAAAVGVIPVLFDLCNGDIQGFRTSNNAFGPEIRRASRRDGIVGGVPTNFIGCHFDEVGTGTNVYVTSASEANFWGCTMWSAGGDDCFGLIVGSGGLSKVWLYGCDLGPFFTGNETTSRALFIQSGSEVLAQGTTFRCASPTGAKRCIDNTGTFRDLGGNDYKWGNDDADGPSVPITVATGGKTVAQQVFSNPSTVVKLPGTDDDSFASWLADGLELMGLTSGAATAQDRGEFLENVNTNAPFWTVAGTPTNVASIKGGVIEITSAGTSSVIRPNPLTKGATPFFFRARMKLGSQAGATTDKGLCGLSDAALIGFLIGNTGSSFADTPDPTKFNVHTYNGTTVHTYNSTIAADTAWHTVTLYSADGSTFYFFVDNEARIPLDKGALPTASNFLQPFFVGTGNHGYRFDRFLAISTPE